MTPGNPMASFRRALPLAGSLAAIQSALALGMAAIILHGPTTATVTTVDFSHTGLGAIIHIGSAFFWAAFAVFLIRITELDQRQQRINPPARCPTTPIGTTTAASNRAAAAQRKGREQFLARCPDRRGR